MKSAALGLFLDWERCPDGVEFAAEDADDPSFKVYRYRSNRRRAERLSIANLEDPIVIRFVNARDEPSRLKFFTRFGLLREFGNAAESIDKIQGQMNRLLAGTGSGDPVTAANAAATALAAYRIKAAATVDLDETGSPRLMWSASDLIEFMRMEAAMVAINGARLTACQHCHDKFLTGPLTGRRSHALYCSDRCRVAAMRQRHATGADHVASMSRGAAASVSEPLKTKRNGLQHEGRPGRKAKSLSR